MSLVDVKPYFRTKLDALGYTEWKDGFNYFNIPESLLDRAYHLEIGSITSEPANQTRHVFSYPVTVRIFLKGFYDVGSVIDDAVSQSEAVLASVLKIGDRLGSDIKDITPSSVDIIPFDISNDNHIILEMSFNAVIDCLFE